MIIISFLEYNEAKKRREELGELIMMDAITEEQSVEYEKLCGEIIEFEERIVNFD